MTPAQVFDLQIKTGSNNRLKSAATTSGIPLHIRKEQYDFEVETQNKSINMQATVQQRL